MHIAIAPTENHPPPYKEESPPPFGTKDFWKGQNSAAENVETTKVSIPKNPEVPSTPIRRRESIKKQSSLKQNNDDDVVDDHRTVGSRRPGVRKTVSFGNHQRMIPIEHVNKIPNRERSRRWLREKDFVNMQMNNFKALQIMEKGLEDITSDNDFTTRGLERHTEKGMLNYTENRRDALVAVLSEQQLQKSDENIAAAYRNETALTRKQAVWRAQRDAQDVKEYLSSDCCDPNNTILQVQRQHNREEVQKKKKDKSFRGRLLKPFRSFSSRRAMCIN